MTMPTPPALAPEVKGSTGIMNDSILHHLSFTYHELAAAFERHMGMTRARWAILSRLSRQGEMTQATLAQLLHVDAAAITRQVKQLEAEGLVTRWSAPEDNRFTVVALTPQGHDFVASLRGLRDEFERDATAGLSVEDIEHMRACLLHLRRNLAHMEAEK